MFRSVLKRVLSASGQTLTRREQEYLAAQGAQILQVANTIKRTVPMLSRELGMPQADVEQVLKGSCTRSQTEELIRRMVASYAISPKLLFVEEDDTDFGVVHCDKEQSLASVRQSKRPNRLGEWQPYYNYYDTVMSRRGPFAPEKIDILRYVDDANPDNPDVVLNHGHMPYQTTFFIGPINFYYRSQGRTHVVETQTGDSNVILPFVPHSFARRREDGPAYILAITYTPPMRSNVSSVARLEECAGDLRDSPSAQLRTRCLRFMNMELMSGQELLNRLDDHVAAVVADLLNGGSVDVAPLVKPLAAALSVREEDLICTQLAAADEVIVRRFRDTKPRIWGEYRVTELARSVHQSSLRSFFFEVLPHATPGQLLDTHLHSYVYNVGEDRCLLEWSFDNGEPQRSLELLPGASVYIAPFTTHRFRHPGPVAAPQLYIVRIAGDLSTEFLSEYASWDKQGRQRFFTENQPWFAHQ